MVFLELAVPHCQLLLPPQVTPTSCELHYYSSRPGLWPIVVGVLKGLAKEYLKYELEIILISSRKDGHDHEVGAWV